MKCEEVLHLIHRQLDNDLTLEEEENLGKHLTVCTSCQAEYEQLKQLSLRLDSLPKVNPPYSIVDSILPELEALEVNDKGVTNSPISRKRHVKKRFWMPGLAMVAGLFIALILLKDPDLSSLEENSYSSGEPELAMHRGLVDEAAPSTANLEAHSEILKEDTDKVYPFSDIPTEEEDSPDPSTETEVGSPGDSGGLKPKESQDGDSPVMGITEFTVDEGEKYASPDGMYTAYLGLHHEEIFIDKEEEPYYISKNSWKAPWVVKEITWVNNDQLYYVLHHPELDEHQYWLINVGERKEEQLEEALIK